MAKTRREFSPKFKREAVALLETSGRPLMQVAMEVGISPSMLRNWRAVVRDGATRSAAFIHASVIQHAKNMQVVGSDGQHVGVIGCVEGTAIKLKGTGLAADGPRCRIPAS